MEDFDYYEGKHQHYSHTFYTHTHNTNSFLYDNIESPQFFNDLKERLGIHEYNQILKAINLYTTDIIDRSELIDMISENEALRKNSDLFKKLKRLISTNTIGQIIQSHHNTIDTILVNISQRKFTLF